MSNTRAGITSQFSKTGTVAILLLAVALAVPVGACGESSDGVETGTPGASSTGGPDGSSTSGGDAGGLPDGAPVGDAATNQLRVTIVSDTAIVLAPGQSATVRAVVQRGSSTGPVTLRLAGLGSDYASKDVVVPPSETSASLTIAATATAAATVTATLEASDGAGIASASMTVSAGVGRVDTRFGSGGMLTLSAGVRDVLALPDSSMILSLAGAVNDRKRPLRMVDSLGKTVPTFGTAGTVNVEYPVVPAGQPAELMFGEGLLARLPDGHLLYASSLRPFTGSGAPALAVARLGANGALDTTFGAQGWAKVYFDGPAELSLTGIALQSDGSVILVGIANANLSGTFPLARSAALAKVTATGAPDSSFGASGHVLTAWNGTYGDARGITTIGGASYVTGYGDAKAQFDRYNGHVSKLAADGSLDPSFGVGGTLKLDIGGVRDVLFTPSGKILVALVGGGYSGPVVGLAATGALDTTFGSQGYLGSTNNYSRDMLPLLVNGKVYVAKCHIAPNRFEVVTYDPVTGREVPTFGGTATLTLPTHPNNVGASKFLRLSDGSMVVAGSATNGDGLVTKFFP